MAGEAEARLRVAYLDHVARLSGGELALLRTLPALAAHVDPVVILAEQGPLVASLERVGIEVRILPLDGAVREARKGTIGRGGVTVAQAWQFGSYCLRLARLLRQLDVDIVHTNSLKADLYGGIAGRLIGVPVVWHVRDRIAVDYLPLAAVRIMRLGARLLPTAIIANSKTTLGTLPEGAHRAVLHSPIATAGASTDPMRTRQGRRSSARPATLTVGIVGRLTPWKGQDVFLKAFALAFKATPVKGRIIGSAMFGEEAWETHLKELATSLGLDEQVVFTGFVEDMEQEYARLDIAIHASTIPEPFGQVVLEAMAAGVPVIAADEGGPAEVIVSGVDGILVSPRDEIALAQAMNELATDPTGRDRLARLGKITVERYSPERAAEGILKVYRAVLPS